MVYAGVQSRSFAEGSAHLKNLSGLSISDERIRRATHQAAEERIAQQDRLVAAYQSKPLPEQTSQKPADVEAPDIACVMCDGGRYQLLDRQASATNPTDEPSSDSERRGKHWHESRVALLATMKGQHHEVDPQPELPNCMEFYAIGSTLSEISKVGSKPGSKETPEQSIERNKQEQAKKELQESLVGPKLVSRNVVELGLVRANGCHTSVVSGIRRCQAQSICLRWLVNNRKATTNALPRIHFGVRPVAWARIHNACGTFDYVGGIGHC
jgi:hypothetical protein